MPTVNQARFTISGSPSNDPTTGDQGYEAINSEVLQVTLEQNPSQALSAKFEVFDPASGSSPLASKDAALIVWDDNSSPAVTVGPPPFGINDTVTIPMPVTGIASYLIRCTASTAGDGSPGSQVQVFERLVMIFSVATLPPVRKTIPAESTQARARAWSDAINDMVEALEGLVAGGVDLQNAYLVGNTIAVVTVQGAIAFSNVADVTNVLQLNRTFAGAGEALQITMGPGNEIVTGRGLDLSSGTGATGTMFFVNNLGSGDALQVQDGGADVLRVLSDGSVQMTASAASTLSTVAGDLTVDAAAAELVLDDVGNGGITLSQSADRALDKTAAGEVLEGATSIVGSVNRLARLVDGAGTAGILEVPIENSVTIAAGDMVAQSTTAGRVTQGNANNNTNARNIGVALTGGTGDAGGTVLTRVALPGNFVTDSGASFTPGAALYAPDGTGRPTEVAPSDTGDVLQRVAWAHSGTEYVLDFGPAVVL